MEIFAEEGVVGKVQLVGNLRDGFVGVAQEDFGGCDDSTINPIFGGHSAGRGDDGAKVSSSDAELIGIEVKLTMLTAMSVDQCDEALEDLMLSGVWKGREGGVLDVKGEDVAEGIDYYSQHRVESSLTGGIFVGKSPCGVKKLLNHKSFALGGHYGEVGALSAEDFGQIVLQSQLHTLFGQTYASD